MAFHLTNKIKSSSYYENKYDAITIQEQTLMTHRWCKASKMLNFFFNNFNIGLTIASDKTMLLQCCHCFKSTYLVDLRSGHSGLISIYIDINPLGM